MDPIEVGIAPERRARLIAKGYILYGKYCGLDRRGICAERFALHHIRLGEPIVARSPLGYLGERIEAFRIGDPDGRLAMTEALAGRIRCHLDGDMS